VDIVEAGRRFRDGSLSPEGLTDGLLARIARENPRLNAFLEVFGKGAREQAAQAARELEAGKDRGPLHGIPIAIKDLFDVAGSVTTAGAHRDFHPPPAREDSEVVARLREAGAVFLGKTGLHEWALGVSSNNAHFGPVRNPVDPSRIPGGSSGGSASAVGAGLCLGALGSDTGGSIRIPAALCGTWGLKPTYGRVSTKGVVPLSVSLDHMGPLANSAADCFLLLRGMCGYVPPRTAKPRVLLPVDPFFRDVDPEGARLVRAAASRFGPVERIDLEDLEPLRGANGDILLSEAAAFHAERLSAAFDKFGASVGPRLRLALDISAVDVARARQVQREWTARLERLLGDESVLCLPATPIPATLIGDREGLELSRVMTRFTAAFNLAGVPVLSAPVGLAGGLPFGMQVVAAPGREGVLAAAAGL
jgi:aspartyl-tRNA(Asn)/glutamyl-tRNA(Gln) amidotransferase subunit A